MWAWYSRRAAWTSCTKSWLEVLLSLPVPPESLLVLALPERLVTVELSSWLASWLRKVWASLLLMSPL